MDPFVIIFFAALLIALFIANQLDREEKRKRERAQARWRGEASRGESERRQVQQGQSTRTDKPQTSPPARQ
jgi:hypothetical protein